MARSVPRRGAQRRGFDVLVLFSTRAHTTGPYVRGIEYTEVPGQSAVEAASHAYKKVMDMYRRSVKQIIVKALPRDPNNHLRLVVESFLEHKKSG